MKSKTKNTKVATTKVKPLRRDEKDEMSWTEVKRRVRQYQLHKIRLTK